MLQDKQKVIANFVDLFLTLSSSQRKTAVELFRDYELIKSFWNPKHPISPKEAICTNIRVMLEWNDSSRQNSDNFSFPAENEKSPIRGGMTQQEK